MLESSSYDIGGNQYNKKAPNSDKHPACQANSVNNDQSKA